MNDFARLAKLLYDYIMSEAKSPWGAKKEESFGALHCALADATCLAFLDHSKPFEIHPDACDYGIGAALVQRDGEHEGPLAFASRLLTHTERNYSNTEKECLVMVWAFGKFHTYIWGAKVKVVTDHHALGWLTSKRDLPGDSHDSHSSFKANDNSASIGVQLKQTWYVSSLRVLPAKCGSGRPASRTNAAHHFAGTLRMDWYRHLQPVPCFDWRKSQCDRGHQLLHQVGRD